MKELRDYLTLPEGHSTNSHFRIMLLTDASKAGLEEYKSLWSQAPIEDLIIFMDLLDKHTRIFSELLSIKNKNIKAKALSERDTKLVKDAEKYRKSQIDKKEQKVRASDPQTAARAKVVKAWAKRLKITYVAAERMLIEMETKNKQRDST